MAFKTGYFMREAATNLRRNKLMTAAGVLTAAVSLLLLGGVFTVGDFVQSITGRLEDEVEVSVFLQDDITPEQQSDIQATLTQLEVVEGVTYVSKEQAYEEFRELFKDDPTLTENVDAEVLPASFRVDMKDAGRVDLVRSKLEDNPAVYSIQDEKEIVDRIVNFTSVLRTFSAVMIAVLFGAAVLLIANTIQLAIYARRKEIEIMKLVGATNWFVRIPFMLEGIVAGVVGAVISMLFLAGAKSLVRSNLPEFIPTVALHGIDPMQALWLVTLGVGIGAIGSAVALRRFLEV